jgi:glutaconate CoA-transferase subunit A
VPDYERDEAFQREYAASAKSDDAWAAWRAEWIDITEDDYQRKVASR